LKTHSFFSYPVATNSETEDYCPQRSIKVIDVVYVKTY